MSEHEFLFALDLSDEPAFNGMLTELTRAVLAHVGLAGRPSDELTAALGRALAEGAAAGPRRCDVRFVAHAGALQVVVLFAGGAQWEVTRPLS